MTGDKRAWPRGKTESSRVRSTALWSGRRHSQLAGKDRKVRDDLFIRVLLGQGLNTERRLHFSFPGRLGLQQHFLNQLRRGDVCKKPRGDRSQWVLTSQETTPFQWPCSAYHAMTYQHMKPKEKAGKSTVGIQWQHHHFKRPFHGTSVSGIFNTNEKNKYKNNIHGVVTGKIRNHWEAEFDRA